MSIAIVSPELGRRSTVAVSGLPSETIWNIAIESSSVPGSTKSVKWRAPTSRSSIPSRSRAVAFASTIQPSEDVTTRGSPGCSHHEPVRSGRQLPSRYTDQAVG